MNRQPRRKARASQLRGMHKIESEVAYGYSPLLFSEPAVPTKKYNRKAV